ncbi:PEP-CTERM sorting domain-containing protein [Lyngbya sp. CCY1209]|uniref:PEP-CTERM sorting domain-containing protein n=1 Tax=Lyngbya sp. CCY1209 TaxID=2886103 RepID=UPI002D208C17|nr:PEP-CTERM sorting domain-containing protein [Lyngbya sp. CCY1209]MEB3885496.1 PEP-CTERM sorting domain-containing protein [Lyngbya sp. CCY1209]
MNNLSQFTKHFLGASAIGTCLLLGATNTAHAASLYFGEDDPDAGTNFAGKAELDFLSNFIAADTEDFEDFDAGTTSPLTLEIGGNEAELVGGGAVRDDDFEGLHAISGEKYWSLTFGELDQDTYTIAFDTAQSAVGFYATDMGDAGVNDFKLKFFFEDGTTAIENIPHTQSADANAYELFFGYINPDLSFTQIEFLANGPIPEDGFGLDDITIGRREQLRASVPEPTSTLALFGVAAIGLFWRNKRRV